MKKIYISILMLISVVQFAMGQVYTEEQISNIGNWDSFSVFSTTASPFTGVDGDGEEEYQLNGIDWPNGDQLKAFMIFDPQRTNPPMEEFWLKPRSGRNLLLFGCNRSKKSDNWLISPQVQLKGGTPQLVFYIQNYHLFWQQYQVLVSTTNNNVNSFTKISDGDYIEAGGKRDSSDPIGYGWKRISFDLSAYANQRVYLAIRHITPSEGIMMAIDDLSIEGSTAGSQLPVADFSANNTTINIGDSVNFSDTSSNSPTSWQWTFQGGTPSSSTARNPSVAYDHPGTYQVVLEATNSDGSSTKTKPGFITVNEGIQADFGAERFEVYEGENVVFRDFSTGNPTSWDWSFPGSNSINSSDQNPIITYPNSGTYSVTLKVSNGALNNTKTKTSYIRVLEPSTPVVDFEANKTNLVEGDQIRFTGSVVGGALAYNWTFEGASPPTSTEETPSVTYFNEGVYRVTLRVTNSVGENTKVKDGYITVVQEDKEYCSAGTSNAGTRGISNVTFGVINNTTQPNSYTYYKDLETRVDPGQTYPISVTTSGQGFEVDATGRGSKVVIWIDWNQDGDFRDANEEKVINNTGSAQYQSNIIVPTDAIGRRTRMRIRSYFSFGDGDEESCGNEAEGEVEDYVVYVNKAELAPIANFTSNTQLVPSGAYVNFEDTSENRVTYWEWTFEGGTPAVSYDRNPQIQYTTSGEYNVTLKVSNATGSDIKTQTRYIQVTGGGGDNQAPTTPQNLVASNITTSSLQLNWLASTDNVGVTGYEVYRDNILVSTIANTSYSDSGLTPDTLYSYYIKAKDQAGNSSPSSTTIQVRTLKEVVDPTCDDGIQNGDETGIDCGGSVCPACPVEVDGGSVSSSDDRTDITTVTGDGQADVITFKNTSQSSASYRYLITDDNGLILTNESVSHDFEGAVAGVCRVYGISYEGTLSVDGKNIADIGLATGAFDISNNWITITRVQDPTCDDGIQNGDETGIDCGGSCEACPTCDDDIQNGDETGIDCGGSCLPCTTETYCTAGQQGTNYIAEVTFGDISNASGNSAYSDYTAQNTSIAKGASATLTVTPRYVSSNWTSNVVGGWIDWNQDGDFTDAGEQVLMKPRGVGAGSATVVVPADATEGTTRLRVRYRWYSDPAPCGAGEGDEVEDYSVTITAGNDPDPGQVVYVDNADVTVNASSTWNFFRIEVGDDNGFGAWYSSNTVRLVTYDKDIVCVGSSSNVAFLGENIPIDGSSNFVANPHSYVVSSSSHSDWNGKTGYIGFTFKINGNTHYGWFHITVASDGLSYTILDYAYHTQANTVIYTGVNRAFGPSNDSKESLVKVSPNPFNDSFEVDLRFVGDKNVSIDIYDLYGKEVSKREYEVNPGKITLGQELSSIGIYFVRIKTLDDVIIKRVMKK
ncbi:PKD domain-containing protein [Aquimarina sp. 2201CG5-10]|uniref:PKD domain-containing protein n=1 Tax=Aquimarina callyspongiae TaxID=3098150 RepID=UPI002AB377E3|nr:PKD domain-containing protein [Aquimarina sp. 2201CG5-10]MDY8134847.1 PKD domain-containing protein [Aquimarina sp. 2201CG5-10]